MENSTYKHFSRYQLLECIGQGGMGKVYKAFDPLLQRNIALKVLISGDLSQQNEVERFIREARITSQLKHPNIVQVHDVGIHENTPFFTMDLIEGTSLKQLVRQSQLSLSQAITLMIKIANAIQYAHDRNVIHRDLKTANIMIDPHNEPIVMDFGLAKMAKISSKLSQSGMLIGTLQYMPPEQAQGRMSEIDEQSDVYSLGACFYEMLTGRPIFKTENPAKAVYNIINVHPTPPRKLRRIIDKHLESICLKALHKQKKSRYLSAGDFANDLQMFVSGKKTSKNPQYLHVTTAIVAIVLAIFSYSLFRQPQQKPSQQKPSQQKTSQQKTSQQKPSQQKPLQPQKFTEDEKLSYDRAIIYLTQGKYQLAKKLFYQLLQTYPNNSRVLLGLAKVHSCLGEDHDAIDKCTTAVKLDPNFSWAYLHRGHVFSAKHNYQKALKDYKRAQSIPGKNSRFQRQLYPAMANAYFQLKNNRSALDKYHKAIQYNAVVNAHDYYNIAQIYASLSLLAEAIIFCEKAQKFFAKKSSLKNTFLQFTEKLNRQLQMAKKQTLGAKDSITTIHAFAKVASYKEFADSINAHPQYKKQLIEVIQNVALVAKRRGHEKYKSQDFSEAEHYFLISLQLGNTQPSVYRYLIEVCYYLKKYDTALEYYRVAIKQSPNNQNMQQLYQKIINAKK